MLVSYNQRSKQNNKKFSPDIPVVVPSPLITLADLTDEFRSKKKRLYGAMSLICYKAFLLSRNFVSHLTGFFFPLLSLWALQAMRYLMIIQLASHFNLYLDREKIFCAEKISFQSNYADLCLTFSNNAEKGMIGRNPPKFARTGRSWDCRHDDRSRT